MNKDGILNDLIKKVNLELNKLCDTCKKPAKFYTRILIDKNWNYYEEKYSCGSCYNE